MSDFKGDDVRDDHNLTPEDLEMLRNLFGIEKEEHSQRLNDLISQLKSEYGYVDKQILIQLLMKEFGVDPNFLDQVQRDIADMSMDHVSHLLATDLHFQTSCPTCFLPKTDLCPHISGEERLEIWLQQGLVPEGLSYLENHTLPELEYLLWGIRFQIINHNFEAIKSLLDKASAIIYGDSNLFNIFRVQVLKIHYLLDQRAYDEALKVADSISPMAEELDMEGDPQITYWMASLSQGMASALLKMGQIQVALDPLLVSTDLFIQNGNQYQVAVSFALISSVMGLLQRREKAEASARRALKLMHELDNEFGLVRVKTFVASGFLALFETEIALDYAMEAVNSALSTGKNTIISALYGLITQIHIVRGDYSSALDVADRCLEFANKQKINELKAIAVALKGDIYTEQRRVKDAIQLYEHAISLLEDGRDDQLILDLDRRIAALEEISYSE
ncbi:MAG: hypothetical protein ACXAE3_13210 [Candidatus Kariarchaeaceae archaeon]|jgi:tetratricopeptide (TPR) repeat protein